MKNYLEYCHILHLSGNIDGDSLRKAYRKASRESHPDAGGETESMKKINEANDALKKKLEQKSPIDCGVYNPSYLQGWEQFMIMCKPYVASVQAIITPTTIIIGSATVIIWSVFSWMNHKVFTPASHKQHMNFPLHSNAFTTPSTSQSTVFQTPTETYQKLQKDWNEIYKPFLKEHIDLIEPIELDVLYSSMTGRQEQNIFSGKVLKFIEGFDPSRGKWRLHDLIGASSRLKPSLEHRKVTLESFQSMTREALTSTKRMLPEEIKEVVFAFWPECRNPSPSYVTMQNQLTRALTWTRVSQENFAHIRQTLQHVGLIKDSAEPVPHFPGGSMPSCSSSAAAALLPAAVNGILFVSNILNVEVDVVRTWQEPTLNNLYIVTTDILYLGLTYKGSYTLSRIVDLVLFKPVSFLLSSIFLSKSKALADVLPQYKIYVSAIVSALSMLHLASNVCSLKSDQYSQEGKLKSYIAWRDITKLIADHTGIENLKLKAEEYELAINHLKSNIEFGLIYEQFVEDGASPSCAAHIALKVMTKKHDLQELVIEGQLSFDAANKELLNTKIPCLPGCCPGVEDVA